ncbi:MAG: hypothetical protein MHM6MM_006279 [Cercozoa sp. M6MM]
MPKISFESSPNSHTHSSFLLKPLASTMPLFFSDFAKSQPKCKCSQDTVVKVAAKDQDVACELTAKLTPQPTVSSKVSLQLSQLSTSLSLQKSGATAVEFKKDFQKFAPVTVTVRPHKNGGVKLATKKKLASAAFTAAVDLDFAGKMSGECTVSGGSDELAAGAKLVLKDSGLAGYDLGAFSKRGKFQFSLLATDKLDKLTAQASFKQSDKLTVGLTVGSSLRTVAPRFTFAGVYKPTGNQTFSAQVTDTGVACVALKQKLSDACTVDVSKKLNDETNELGICLSFAL